LAHLIIYFGNIDKLIMCVVVTRFAKPRLLISSQNLMYMLHLLRS